jgi:hypothetical protein
MLHRFDISRTKEYKKTLGQVLERHAGLARFVLAPVSTLRAQFHQPHLVETKVEVPGAQQGQTSQPTM